MLRPNRLKARIREGQQSVGTWVQSGSATFAEIAALAGFDFLIVDQEHGPSGLEGAIDAMRAAACAEATVVIRVPSAEPVYLRRLVDAGAQALLVPMVESADEARAVVEAVRFPPHGKRGNAAEITRSSRYGLVPDYYAQADESLLIVVQVETLRGVENAGSIAAVDGVDVVFIGPTDLSCSMGLPNQTGAAQVNSAIAQAMVAVRAAGKPLATVPRIGRTLRDLADEGFAMVASGSDIAFYRMAAQGVLREWREAASEEKRSPGYGG